MDMIDKTSIVTKGFSGFSKIKKSKTGIHFTSYKIWAIRMINADKRVLPIEINLVLLDTPKIIDRKSMKTSSKQDKYLLDSEDDADKAEEMNCNNVLNRIMPPKQWEKNGVTYTQKISNQPATNFDVEKLGLKLDNYLKQYSAREVGICPIKRELYSQCFNEVIRQVTLNCVERGFMLIKIRDEINMTIDSYQELFESIIAHGIRKALLREHRKTDLEKRAEKLKTENAMLKAQLAETIAATAQLKRESAEARDAENKRRADELNALKKTNQLLRAQLESIIMPKKMT